MNLRFVLETVSVISIIILLITQDCLRKRDTTESKIIFWISVLAGLDALLNMLLAWVINADALWVEENDEMLIYGLVFGGMFESIISLLIIMGWNLFVDYAIYKSYYHMFRKQKYVIIPGFILSVAYMAYFVGWEHSLIGDQYSKYEFMNAMNYFCAVFQLVYIINAIVIVVRSGKRRRPPTFLRLDLFLIPVVLGFMLTSFALILPLGSRSVFTVIAIALTWWAELNRYKYVDPHTGFYNRDFLSSMNDYMERSGYSNGIGVLFKAPGSGDKLVPVLEEYKPADSEIFSMGEDEFLLMAGPQKESVIRLLIKSVKLGAAESGSPLEIESSYAIRGKNESTREFTRKLLEPADSWQDCS